MSTTPILDSLTTRKEQLTPVEVEALAIEVAQAAKTSGQLDTFVRKIEKSGLVSVPNFKARAEFFQKEVAKRSLEGFTGHVGLTDSGTAINPKDFRFVGVDAGTGAPVYISDRFAATARNILLEAADFPELKTYFAGAHSTLTKTLGLARLLLDHDAVALRDSGIKSDEEITLMLWELLARMDFELDGASPKDVFGSTVLTDQYLAIKAAVEMAGLKPMAQRALAIRDGREKP
ncbi:MAG: hypothetical protein Q7T11_01595, partial [Deltaproteobacteria bacterium]|nr:hypothetical protein [Deltaproteobacteria bacterium]